MAASLGFVAGLADAEKRLSAGQVNGILLTAESVVGITSARIGRATG